MDSNKLDIESLKGKKFDLGITIDIKDGAIRVVPRNIKTPRDICALLFYLVGYIKLSKPKKIENEKSVTEKINKIILKMVNIGLKVTNYKQLTLCALLFLKD